MKRVAGTSLRDNVLEFWAGHQTRNKSRDPITPGYDVEVVQQLHEEDE